MESCSISETNCRQYWMFHLSGIKIVTPAGWGEVFRHRKTCVVGAFQVLSPYTVCATAFFIMSEARNVDRRTIYLSSWYQNGRNKRNRIAVKTLLGNKWFFSPCFFLHPCIGGRRIQRETENAMAKIGWNQNSWSFAVFASLDSWLIRIKPAFLLSFPMKIFNYLVPFKIFDDV